MATTCEPARLLDPATNPADASPRLLAVPGLDDPAAPPHPDLESDQDVPPPNPHFVFPARDPASAPPSFSRATGRRPQSAIETNKIPGALAGVEAVRSSRPSLPAFSFNPGVSSSQPDDGFLSPPLSPPMSATRPGGHRHRRGGSEYVGGSIRDGDSIMSISPTSPESEAPAGPQPPPTRRGRHAHRRSAALSGHDLSIVLQPPGADSGLRGGSAPTSPAIFNTNDVPPLPSFTMMPKPAEPEQIVEEPVKSNSPANSAPVEPPSEADQCTTRARVGFSETVEFIPRPLSMISNDTSSTVTAAKPGHSVSGSISSLMSAPTPAVEKTSLDEVPPTPAREKAESRPSTAGAVLERTPSTLSAHPNQSSPRRRSSVPALVQPSDAAVESPEPSPTKPKRWSFFGLEPFTSSQQSRPRPDSSGSTEPPLNGNDPKEGSPNDVSAVCALKPSKGSPARKRKGKKPSKKVKTWAGSILTRKSKPRVKSGKNSRPSTANLEDGDKRTAQLGERTQQSEATTPTTPEITINFENSVDGAYIRHPSTEEDSSYQMIDLDAALGPFNTPLPHNPEWEAAQKAAGNTKRRLHSAQKLRGFSGPGMHYHRRTESAPEMVPFEDSRFGMHRFGSNSTMADVFEEDEEDEEEMSSSTSESEYEKEGEKEAPAPSEPSHETASTPEAPTQHPISTGSPSGKITRRRSSGWSDIEEPQSVPVERIPSAHEDAVGESSDAVQFRTSNIFQGNSSPAKSATPSPRRMLAARDLAPVDVSPLQLPAVAHAPVSPYSMSHGSSFPSPRSPMSVDAQRISTAPSSVNEETSFQSLLLGQPGPEVRISADDVPSLTSTNSTMTRESAATSHAQQQQQTLPKRRPERPASVSTAFGRRRSSLASLSRLISSSHGERSKLSTEVHLDDEPDKKDRTKKTKRLSRLVQFWKGREGGSS